MNVKGQIVQETINRFPQFGNLTIAKIIFHQNGNVFENNLEKIRSLVRYYRGALRHNYKVDGKPTTPKMPPTWRKPQSKYHLDAGLWLVLADIHVPFHEPKAIESAIDYGHKNKITGILFGGAVAGWMSRGSSVGTK